MPFQFERLSIPEVVLVTPKRFEDGRGVFMETYKRSEFSAFGIKDLFVQDNHSLSRRGVLRGLHYQAPPDSQAKLVRVVSGEIFDVAVDIRVGSPTYSRWVGITLSAASGQLFFVPAGFAHGFCALSDAAEVLYKTTSEYSAALDFGIRWDDTAIGIEWPISRPVISDRDSRLPALHDAEAHFIYKRGA